MKINSQDLYEFINNLAPNGISKSAVRYLARCQVRKD